MAVLRRLVKNLEICQCIRRYEREMKIRGVSTYIKPKHSLEVTEYERPARLGCGEYARGDVKCNDFEGTCTAGLARGQLWVCTEQWPRGR
jgi:hypothetical protein